MWNLSVSSKRTSRGKLCQPIKLVNCILLWIKTHFNLSNNDDTLSIAVLAASSKKLAQLLSDSSDDDMTTILIPDRDFSTVKSILHYIYAGEVLVGSLTGELESLILEWDIVAPEITPCDAAEFLSLKSISFPAQNENLDTAATKSSTASTPTPPSKKRTKLSGTIFNHESVIAIIPQFFNQN